MIVKCEQLLTQDTNSGLRGHLDISGHHILYGKTPTFLLPWNKRKEKIYSIKFTQLWSGNEVQHFTELIKKLIVPLWQRKSNAAACIVCCQNTWKSCSLCMVIIATMTKSDDCTYKIQKCHVSGTTQDLFSYAGMSRLSVMPVKNVVIPAYFMCKAIECHSETTSQQVLSEQESTACLI